MPRYRKPDANQKEIVEALEAVGATVWIVDQVMDIVVGFQGVNYIMEIKTAKGKPRPSQVKFMENWEGETSMPRTVEDALRVIGRM